MNRRVKLGLGLVVTLNFLMAVLICCYFAVPILTHVVDKFTTTGDELLPPLAPQKQGPTMAEHKVPQVPQSGLRHLRTGDLNGTQSTSWGGTTATKMVTRDCIAESLPPQQHKVSQELVPQSVIDRIKTFIFFVGHPCSGHSIIGSLIDSHPHMVVSHEYTLFRKLSTGALAPTKPEIFNALWKTSQAAALKHGVRSINKKGYTLFVDGLYQGRYVDYIDVIGDKRGDCTIEMFIKTPSDWLSVYSILQSLNVTLKVIHVIRNPYDNIASMLFMYTSRTPLGSIKQSNKTHTFNSDLVLDWIRVYFQLHEGIVKVKKEYNLDIIEIHGKDLILDPKGTLLKLCNQLGVACSDDYLEMCNKKAYKTESRTRYLVKWTDMQLKLIQQNIKKYSCLKGYTFDSM